MDTTEFFREEFSFTFFSKFRPLGELVLGKAPLPSTAPSPWESFEKGDYRELADFLRHHLEATTRFWKGEEVAWGKAHGYFAFWASLTPEEELFFRFLYCDTELFTMNARFSYFLHNQLAFMVAAILRERNSSSRVLALASVDDNLSYWDSLSLRGTRKASLEGKKALREQLGELLIL